MPKFGLYIHWPFCAAKCPYCDFNSHVSARIDQTRWRAAYLSEIRRVARLTDGRVLSTVFFGGGTPSLMDPDLVAAILTEVRASWPIANDLEVTLEANPTSAEASRFRGFEAAGVNRLSLGVQALNDPDLKALGRLHSAQDAMDAFAMARETFPQVSFDLIYARQRQTHVSWKSELSRALDLAADHLSIYQLTIEDGTAFGARHRDGKLPGLPHEDLAADLFELTQEMTSAAGLPAYEVSNHARDGAKAKHNLIYWESGDYAGIGPGAHGRLTLSGVRWATETPLAPEAWLSAVEAGETDGFAQEALTDAEHLAEFLLMGLRLQGGIDRGRLAGLDPDPGLFDRMGALEADGLIETTPTHIALTPRGRPLLNSVLRAVLA